MALFLEIEPGEGIVIGADIRVKFEKKSGRKIRLRIEADRTVPIRRFGEVSLPPVGTPDRKTQRGA